MIALLTDRDSVEIMETEEDRSTTMTLTWERTNDLFTALGAALQKHKKQEDGLSAK